MTPAERMQPLPLTRAPRRAAVQHPARDAHDTFFLKEPAEMRSAPEDYVARVAAMHERGGHGSSGYNYPWKRSEANKNILRTHTTAVSARMLHAIAQGGFRPAKYFSIDRVFRNEAVDKTHLAEFHQARPWPPFPSFALCPSSFCHSGPPGVSGAGQPGPAGRPGAVPCPCPALRPHRAPAQNPEP